MRLVVRPSHLHALLKAAQLSMFGAAQPGQRATVKAHARVTKEGKVVAVKQHERRVERRAEPEIKLAEGPPPYPEGALVIAMNMLWKVGKDGLHAWGGGERRGFGDRAWRPRDSWDVARMKPAEAGDLDWFGVKLEEHGVHLHEDWDEIANRIKDEMREHGEELRSQLEADIAAGIVAFDTLEGRFPGAEGQAATIKGWKDKLAIKLAEGLDEDAPVIRMYRRNLSAATKNYGDDGYPHDAREKLALSRTKGHEEQIARLYMLQVTNRPLLMRLWGVQDNKNKMKDLLDFANETEVTTERDKRAKRKKVRELTEQIRELTARENQLLKEHQEHVDEENRLEDAVFPDLDPKDVPLAWEGLKAAVQRAARERTGEFVRDPAEAYTNLLKDADYYSQKLHGPGTKGRHWGSSRPSNQYAREVVLAAGGTTMREVPSLKEVEITPNPVERVRGLLRRKYAQDQVKKFPRKKHPEVYRGMAIHGNLLRALQPGDNLPLVGCTAFSFRRDIGLQYSDSTWTREHAPEGAEGVLLTLKRTPTFDASIGMWHHDQKDKSKPAFELLSTAQELRVVSVTPPPPHSRTGRWQIEVEVGTWRNE